MARAERPGWLIPAFVALQLVLLAALTRGWRVAGPAPQPPQAAPRAEAQLGPLGSALEAGWPQPFAEDCGGIALSCGAVVTGTTWNAAETLGDSFYRATGCPAGLAPHRGPERVYGLQVDAVVSYQIEAALDWPSAASDVALIKATGPCPGTEPVPSRCALSGRGHVVSVFATGSTRWWIVVDGPYEEPFTLRVTCTPA